MFVIVLFLFFVCGMDFETKAILRGWYCLSVERHAKVETRIRDKENGIRRMWPNFVARCSEFDCNGLMDKRTLSGTRRRLHTDGLHFIIYIQLDPQCAVHFYVRLTSNAQQNRFDALTLGADI